MARQVLTSQPSASFKVSTLRPANVGRANNTAADPANGST
jgi:hypothetical protein